MTYRSFALQTRLDSLRNAFSMLLPRALSPRKLIDSLDCDLGQLSSVPAFSLCRDGQRIVTAVPLGDPPTEAHGYSHRGMKD